MDVSINKEACGNKPSTWTKYHSNETCYMGVTMSVWNTGL